MAAKEVAASCLEVAGFTIIFDKLVHLAAKEGAASCLEVGRFTIIFELLIHVATKEGADSCLEVSTSRVFNILCVADPRGSQVGSRQLSGGEQGLQLFLSR